MFTCFKAVILSSIDGRTPKYFVKNLFKTFRTFCTQILLTVTPLHGKNISNIQKIWATGG